MLPSLTSRLAPRAEQGHRDRRLQQPPVLRHLLRRGGGRLSRTGGGALAALSSSNAVLLVIWLMVAAGMRVPGSVEHAQLQRCRRSMRAQAEALVARLRALPGVREAQLIAGGEHGVSARWTARGFDEHNVASYDCREGELTWPQSTK